MTKKERILAALNHEEVDNIPMMYRARDEMHKKLLNYLGLNNYDYQNVMDFYNILNISNLIEEREIGKYRSTFFMPKYIGPLNNNIVEIKDPDLSYVWGLGTKLVKTEYEEYIQWGATTPMKEFTTVKEIEDYPSPKLEDFDFSEFKVYPEIKKDFFYGTGVLSYLFMLASWLRGMENFLMDMIVRPKLAEAIVNKIGEFAVIINSEILNFYGEDLEYYVIWDDVASQDDIIMDPSLWRKYFKKWYKKLVDNAKNHNLIIFYHLCGNCTQIIPDLIEIGVQLLDPVQTSARNMDLLNLKKRFGNDLCFHGGIDVQNLLPKGSINDIRFEVKKSREIFGLEGGLILGPSHRITPDTPIKNILALYLEEREFEELLKNGRLTKIRKISKT